MLGGWPFCSPHVIGSANIVEKLVNTSPIIQHQNATEVIQKSECNLDEVQLDRGGKVDLILDVNASELFPKI